jgi:hypothetical protein
MSLRALARTSVGLFALSTAFPVVAGVLNMPQPPRWLGTADVVVAAVLFVVAATVATRTRRVVTDSHRLVAFRNSQSIIGAIPLLLAAYFIAGPRVNWTVLVVGLAWRGWLLLYTLPFLAAALVGVRPHSAGVGPPSEHAPRGK